MEEYHPITAILRMPSPHTRLLNDTGGGLDPFDWVQIYPVGTNRGPIPPEVPEHIARDYSEACRVLPSSAKASAALSRRCLQTILHEHGYNARDLAKEIELLLNETDPQKMIPETLRMTVDAIRTSEVDRDFGTGGLEADRK
jgi:hypothetical protein